MRGLKSSCAQLSFEGRKAGPKRPLCALHDQAYEKMTSAERGGDRMDAFELQVEGRSVSVALRVDRRAKRIILRIDPVAARPVVTIPHARHAARARRFAGDRVAWIADALGAVPRSRPLAEGASIDLRGAAHAVRVDPAALRTEAQDGVIRLKSGRGDVAFALEAFLRREARADLTEATRRHAETLGVSFARIRIADQKRRWGSCSTSGTLSFSWRLVMAPPFVLDYVAAHEVAHLREMNHSPRFWAHVARLRPDRRAASDWLKANGSSLHAVGRSLGSGP